MKNSELNIENINDNQVLNPETCLLYTDKDKLLEGIEDRYSDQVIHKKSKIFDTLDIPKKTQIKIEKNIYQQERRKSQLK